MRRWDGSRWTNDVRPAAPGGPATGPGRGRNTRIWLIAGAIILVAIVVLVALSRLVSPGPVVEDSNSSTPTVSGWDEGSAPTPDPDNPAPANCEPADIPAASAEGLDTLTVGPLTMPKPGAGWSGPQSEPRMPLGSEGWGYVQKLPYDKPWQSSMAIGLLADPDFTSTSNSARRMAQCILTSGFYATVDVTMDDYSEQEISVGRHAISATQADFIVRFDDPDLETKGSRLRLIVIDSTPERSWFFSGVPVERDDHADAVEVVTAGLYVAS